MTPMVGRKQSKRNADLRVCLSLGLPRAGEGLGYRQGMLFKTKKEMLAQNGKERKQLPVSGF